MRYYLSILTILLFSGWSSVFAQCTPDANPMQKGAYPSTLPAVCLGVQYNQTITIVAPVDTVLSGFLIPLDSMKLQTPTLPLGFSALCGDITCTSYPQAGATPARSCLELTGNTNTEFETDTLFLPVTYYVTLFGSAVPIEEEVYVLWDTKSVDTAVSIVGSTLIAQASNATYQWVDCDAGMNPIMNATGPSYTAVETGNYALEVTQDGCPALSSCYSVGALGVDNQLSGTLINVFPNPTDGIFYIDLAQMRESVFLRIFDAVGALVYEDNLNENQIGQIQMSVPNGVYTLELSTNKGESIRKTIIIQPK